MVIASVVVGAAVVLDRLGVLSVFPSEPGLLFIPFLTAALLIVASLVSLREAIWVSAEWKALASNDLPASGDGTLLARRAARVADLSASVPVASAEWRALLKHEAAQELSRIGQLTRHMASLLLLSAVVSTFAGMRAALPGLISAIEKAGAETTASAERIESALRLVGDTFGGNLFAIVGALALSIAAYGLQSERQPLLHRLEQEAERRFYRELAQEGGADALSRAIAEMRDAVAGVTTLGQHIAGLDQTLDGFRGALDSAVQSIGKSFQHTLLHQAREQNEQLRNEVAKVSATLFQTSGLYRDTALAYQGLTQVLVSRNEDLAGTQRALNQVLLHLQAAVESTGRVVAEAGQMGAAHIKSASVAAVELIKEASGGAASTAESLRAVQSELFAALQEQRQQMGREAQRSSAAAERIATGLSIANGHWGELQGRLEQVAEDHARATAALTKLGDEVAHRLEAMSLTVLERTVNELRAMGEAAEQGRARLLGELRRLARDVPVAIAGLREPAESAPVITDGDGAKVAQLRNPPAIDPSDSVIHPGERAT